MSRDFFGGFVGVSGGVEIERVIRRVFSLRLLFLHFGQNKIFQPRIPKYLTTLIKGTLGIRVSSAAVCLRGSVTKCHSTSNCIVVEKRAWGLRLIRAIIQQNERQCLQARQFFQLDN